MSILLAEVVPEGIIFGADRNVSWSREEVLHGNVVIQNLGHTQRSKVLRWPQRKALIGYVGAAQVGGVPTDEWLYDFIGRYNTFERLETLAEALRAEIEAQRRIDERTNSPEALILHLGGFELVEGICKPFIWFVRNAYGMDDRGNYTDIRREFQKSEEFWLYFPDTAPERIGILLGELACQFNPFWFHHGFDLGTFNTIEGFLKRAFKALCDSSPAHSLPLTLSAWESQVRMSILTYGAYFQAYRGPSEQFVGGGADIVSIPWPRTA